MNTLCTFVLAAVAFCAVSARSLDGLEELTIDERLAQAAGEQSAFAVFPEDGTVRAEMDILYTQEQWDLLQLQRDEPALYKAASSSRFRWTNKVVPYTISSAFSSADRAAIQKAVDEWNRKTCLTLKPRTNERNYVSIVDGNGCSSFVGMIGGAQRLTLGRGCRYHATIVHEFGHAIGFQHEHQRPERDSYVTINLQNVIDGFKFAFDKYSSSHVNAFGVAYDYGSVMHYGQTAFSKNGRTTMQTKDPYWQSRIGRAPGLADSDVKLAKIIYNCIGSTTVQPQGCKNVHPDDAECKKWANSDECVKNPYWMSRNCALACNTC